MIRLEIALKSMRVRVKHLNPRQGITTRDFDAPAFARALLDV